MIVLAAITVQIGHGGHRVADSYATDTLAHGDHHASEVKTENDRGRPSHDLRSARLFSSVSCVTDADKRLRNRLSLLHVSLPSRSGRARWQA